MLNQAKQLVVTVATYVAIVSVSMLLVPPLRAASFTTAFPDWWRGSNLIRTFK
jgi:hypothetical protein